MNPAPNPISAEQLKSLIPAPIPDGTFPGAPARIDCQGFTLKGIISQRTGLMDTLIRGQMKPTDKLQSSNTCRSLLELTAILSHERADNLPPTPTGQPDFLDRAVGLLTGSFTHPPQPDLHYSYAKDIYPLLPKGERLNQIEIISRFKENMNEIGRARQSGQPLPKELKQKAAVSSLRMICLLGSGYDFQGQEAMFASGIANVIRINRLGEEIGELVGLKFEEKADEKPAGLEKSKIPREMLFDEQGFSKGEIELKNIKSAMLVGEGDKPLRMAENLTTLDENQRKGLNLRKILEQIRSPGDLRVLATNGHVSVYALRIPHPEQVEIFNIHGIPNAYLNLIVAVGPHCTPVVLKDSSLNEGYARNEPPPEKYENGHYHNYFEELDKGRSEYFYQYAGKYPSRAEGIFSFLQTGKTDFFTPGKYIFISNEGKIVMSPETSSITSSIRMSDERLSSGESVFFMYAPQAHYVKYDAERGFIPIKESEGCDQYCNLGNLGLFVRRGEKSEDPEQLILLDQTGRVSRLRLAPDLSYSYSGRDKPPNHNVAVIELGLKDYRTHMEKYSPPTVVIINDNGKLLPGYASARVGFSALSDESVFDPQTQTVTINSTMRSGYYYGDRIIRAKFVPSKDGGIGWWISEATQITAEPAVEFDRHRLGEIIFSRLAKEPIVRNALQLPALTGTIHPDQLNDVISRELSDKLYPMLVGQFGAVDDVEQLYDQVKPALTQVINKCMDDLNDYIVENNTKITPIETQELINRYGQVNDILQGLPQKVKPFQ